MSSTLDVKPVLKEKYASKANKSSASNSKDKSKKFYKLRKYVGKCK